MLRELLNKIYYLPPYRQIHNSKKNDYNKPWWYVTLTIRWWENILWIWPVIQWGVRGRLNPASIRSNQPRKFKVAVLRGSQYNLQGHPIRSLRRNMFLEFFWSSRRSPSINRRKNYDDERERLYCLLYNIDHTPPRFLNIWITE